MKIGIVGCFFNCAKNLRNVLAPWQALKRDQRLILTGVNALFKENAELGMENNDDETRRVMHTCDLDYVSICPVPLTESQARNQCLEYLLHSDVDLIWLLDGDEFYSVDQIREIIYFVEKRMTETNSYFSINFKNHVFDGVEWVDGFCPPRIFFKKIHGGIDQFYWDNDITYLDGTNYKVLNEIKIPRETAHIRHMTWLHENGKEKYEYQVKHFGQCSYKWNYETEKLEFDLDYYEKHSLPVPELKIG